MLLSIMGMISTSAFAVRATDVFPSGIVAESIIGQIECLENGLVSVNDCSSLRTALNEAPYKSIKWPKFTGKTPDIFVASGEIRTISPATYGSINVEDGAKLYLNPGVYWVNEYIINGQVLPANGLNGTDIEGTVTLLVKKTVDLSGSQNNSKVVDGKSTAYEHPNRYVLYTEDNSPSIDNVSISGYIYFKNSININQNVDVWGAISAKSMIINNAILNVNVDLSHLIFTNFDTFLEVGPNMKIGWHMVKAPAEISESNIITVEDFFGDDLGTSTFRTDWRVYERNYSGSGSYYTELDDLNKTLDKNRGYWLGTKKDADLKVLGLDPVVWDRGIEGCPTKNKGCYRYTLQRCTEGDTSPYLYNLIGSVSSTESDWKDYRIEVDKNGILMTPKAASDAGIMSNQIWKYSPSTTGTYVTADDTGALGGDSNIDYFEGFWVEVNCTNRIGETIDLIIPNGKVK